MANPTSAPKLQATSMLFAWVGALLMLAVLWRTPVALAALANHSIHLPLMGVIVLSIVVTMHSLVTRKWSALPSVAACALLGALFTTFSFALTVG